MLIVYTKTVQYDRDSSSFVAPEIGSSESIELEANFGSIFKNISSVAILRAYL